VTTAAKLPKALGKTPLLEAIFEVRFRPTIPSAGDVLPGLLFADFRTEYTIVEQLPAGAVPREIRESNPNLVHQPTHRLTAPKAGSTLQVGDRMASVTLLYPYPGWGKFRERVVSLLKSVKRTGLVAECERFAFRYVNVITAPKDGPRLPMLTVQFGWPGHPITERGLHLRFERDEGEFVTIFQISPDVTGKVGDATVSGLLIDIDTIRPKVPATLWDPDVKLLEDAHSFAKQTFYALLTDATLRGLEPIYEDPV